GSLRVSAPWRSPTTTSSAALSWWPTPTATSFASHRWTDTAAIRAPANARPAATCGRRCVARRVHRCQPGVCIAEGPQERAGHGFVRRGAVLGTTAHITVARGQPLTDPY